MTSTLDERLQQPFWPSEMKLRAALGFAVVLGAVLRSIRLMDLFPVLVDEAIYMRWAEIIQHDHTWFISLLDAKPPLAYWIYAAVRLVFPHDPLLGSRLISVAAGTLCVVAVYRVGFLCAGMRAGIVTALLYSLLPFGVFYDRIAYVDSLTNLCGVLLVYVTLSCFGAPTVSWARTIMVGMMLGVALFIKTTILLVAPAPAVIALYLRRTDRNSLFLHLSPVYGVAALFPLVSHFAVPQAPTFEVNNVLLHHTNFFTPLAILARDPLFNIRFNGPLLTSYAASYVTYAALVATMVASVALWRAGRRLPIVVLVVSLVPFVVPVVMLEYFPSRYAFPHTWPLLLVVGSSTAIGSASRRARTASWIVTAVVLVSTAVQSGRILRTPERALDAFDAEEFLGGGPYSGFGVLEAVEFLRSEARSGPITILTDPWWGPPTDVVFAYLNDVDGTKVYEAWWLQRDGKYPLVPAGEMPVWMSQYQRVNAGEIDFSALPRLYYITDTNYHTPENVHDKNPRANLIRRFPKRGGARFVDVYRLN